MSKPERIQTTVRIDKDLKKVIDREHIRLSDIVNDALRRYLEKKGLIEVC